jgi:DNA-binding CsgD family transcriptional regulator
MGIHPGETPIPLARQGPGTLLEREGELQVVAEALGESAGGRGSLVVLDGPAGIGKSRLLRAAEEMARARGVEVLRARCSELERDFPYGVVRQLFETRLAACGQDERAGLLAGVARAAAPLFEPADVRPPEGEGADFATLHGLFWLTANVAERAPALISVDDVQWCDRPSLRFLAYLARRVEALPVLLAVSLRLGEPSVDATVLADLESEPHPTVRPAPLSVDAVRRMLEIALDRQPAAEFARAVHAASGGNPLMVTELAHAIRAEGMDPTADAAARVAELGPEALARSVLRRIRRVGAGAEALARAVAVLGDDCELSLASELAALGAEGGGAAAAALARAGILTSRGPLTFVHPVLRAAVYAEPGDVERRLAHERAAELLSARGAPAERVAVHLLHARATGDAATVETLRAAGRRAMAQGAADTARTYLARALAEPPDPGRRGEVLLELGVAELRSGVAATAHLEEADRLLEGGPRSLDALLALSSARFADGRHHDAAEVLRDRIERLGPGDATTARRLEAHLIGWARFDAELYPMARDRLAAIPVDAGDDSLDGRYLCALAASELARAGESPARARELVRRALGAGPRLGDESGQAYGMALAVLLTLDDLDAAAQGYGAWLDDARRRGMAFSAMRASAFRALAMLRRGELAEAEADARIALDAARSLTRERGHPEPRAFLAEVLAERGRPDEAAATLGAIPDDGDRRHYGSVHPLELRGRLRIASGDPEGGLADLLEVGERLDTFGVRNPSYSSWRSSAALVLQRLGDRAEAGRLVEEELALARRWGAPRPIATALRGAGLIDAAGAGLEHLRASADALRDSPALLERAKSLTELGAALRRANRRAEARPPLLEGLELAERCDAAPVAERAHAELLATGARPRRLVRTGVDALTPSERRVALMAADGQTNREIAQALFVTAKTVEMHLSNVYRKLDITARSQLPRALGRDAEVPAQAEPARSPVKQTDGGKIADRG